MATQAQHYNCMNEEKQALLGVALARLNAIKFDLHHKHSNVQVSFLNKNTWESADYLEGVFECEDNSQFHFVRTPLTRAFFLFRQHNNTWVYLERHSNGQNFCFSSDLDGQGQPILQTLQS